MVLLATPLTLINKTCLDPKLGSCKRFLDPQLFAYDTANHDFILFKNTNFFFLYLRKESSNVIINWLEHFYSAVSSPLNHFMQSDHNEYNLRMSCMFSLPATACRIPSSLFFSAKSKKGPLGNFSLSQPTNHKKQQHPSRQCRLQ